LLPIGPSLDRRRERKEVLLHDRCAGDGIRIGLDFLLNRVSPGWFFPAGRRGFDGVGPRVLLP
jgi:hypothetical protein